VDACEALWVSDADCVSEGVLDPLRVTLCDPVDVLVGVPVVDGVELLLGVVDCVRLCDWVSEGVPVDDAVAACEALWVCEADTVAEGVTLPLGVELCVRLCDCVCEGVPDPLRLTV
jgi:hypothetical protein